MGLSPGDTQAVVRARTSESAFLRSVARAVLLPVVRGCLGIAASFRVRLVLVFLASLMVEGHFSLLVNAVWVS
jgi:hypothetical protein